MDSLKCGCGSDIEFGFLRIFEDMRVVRLIMSIGCKCGFKSTIAVDVPRLEKSDNLDKYKAEAISAFRRATSIKTGIQLTGTEKAVLLAILNNESVQSFFGNMPEWENIFKKVNALSTINLPTGQSLTDNP